jgi:hypothetical protein
MHGNDPVVLYIRPGHIEAPKQQIALLRWLDEHGHRSEVSLCFSPEDCAALVAALVAAGAAPLVLTVDADPVLKRLVEEAGGQVESLRRPPTPPRRALTVPNVIRRLYGRGRSVAEIADTLEATTAEIRLTLHRLGYRPK